MDAHNHDQLRKELKDYTDKKINGLRATMQTFKSEIRQTLAPIHDYIVGQEAVAKNKQEGNIQVSKDIVKIILYLAAIAAALLGVSQV